MWRCFDARRLLLAVLLSATAGCATTPVVTSGGGAGISEAQAERYDGPKARIAVGPIIDKSGNAGTNSLQEFLKDDPSGIDKPAVLGSIRDMLTTALFNSNRYIVLERDAIKDVLVEQDFATSQPGNKTLIPVGEIEGAELLVTGSLTAFKAAKEGGGFPIPIPLGKNANDIAIFRIGASKSYVAMDIRVIDTASGRILATTAVEGTSWKNETRLEGFIGKHTGYGFLHTPGLIRVFSNTPVEKALSEMVNVAVAVIIRRTPEDYRRYPSTSDTAGEP
ncbi:MAG: CsgG/HfaB family protein [Gammaproteobacteria bacterium]|nr:CsgG/HfaB family protein [Gammaproteobacteria bacterium]